MELTCFANESLFNAMQSFFEQLNIPVNRITEKPVSPQKILTATFKPDNPAHQLMSCVYFLGMVDDNAFEGVEEGARLNELTKDYDGLLVFGVDLKERERGLFPARGQLAEITRCFNREYHYTPVVVLFRYNVSGEPYISFTSCERIAYKQDWREGEKAGRVSILKDIKIHRPHCGHLRIFDEMAIVRAGKKAVNSFAELNAYWQDVFSIQILNQAFYDELFNWYLWACKTVSFPRPADDGTDEKTHTSISVIRLLTRIIFCWFIKEKDLLPESIFDSDYLSGILKKFSPFSEDKSDYYTAILQNLFFATLNTDMPKDVPGSRRFQKPNNNTLGYSEDYLDHLVYRYEDRFTDSRKALDLFASIPFLNGGLFECLDTRDIKTREEYRYDGFSSKASKQPKVPNVLFFVQNKDVDLSDDFDGDKKKKHVSVRGLIKILESYKFTIAENTPLEQEIALDPELLGKVFENLLASYNPETKTTARKQTGSFYTPREIVNYMVDESLIAYLKTKLTQAPQSHEELAVGQLSALGNDLMPGQTRLVISQNGHDEKWEKKLEERLRRLFDLSFSGNPFADDERTGDRIIEHLSNCRILDPACGSGAFPMGALHKMVFVLGKLDPNNRKWKQAQLKKAERDLDAAKKMEDAEIREKAVESAKMRIDYIKESFERHKDEFDYSRKLFLIENCIYGVDIQNIAVQISKLRFFISLMVDQQVDDKKPNKGILSLPNLETKFVAANTLIGLSAEIYNIGADAQKTEKELTGLRSKIFFTRKYGEKKKLKKQEAEIRQRLWDEIYGTTLQKDIADKIAGWNPFDPIHSAPFFDLETMFGFKGGFDVVIGNPPYVRQESIKELKPFFKDVYTCFTGVADLYVYFYEKGVRLLNQGSGILSFISSNKYFRAGYGEKLRQFLGENTSIIRLIDFGDAPVFDAIAYPCIFIARKDKPAGNNSRVMAWEPGPRIDEFARIFQNSSFEMAQKELTVEGWRLESRDTLRLLDKLKKAGKPLGEYVNGRFYRGILTGLNEAFVIGAETRERLIKEDKKSAEVIKPFLRGRDVKRWKVNYDNLYLIFTRRGISINNYPAIKKHLYQFKEQLMPGGPGGRKPGSYEWYEIQDNIAYWEEFEKPKIIYPDIAQNAEFAYDTDKYYLANTLYLLPTAKIELLGILNSNVIFWYYNRISTQIRGGFVRFIAQYVSEIPVVSEIAVLRGIVQKCMQNKTLPLESCLDALVAHLYKLTEEEYTIILDDLKLPDPVRMACLNDYREISRNGMVE